MATFRVWYSTESFANYIIDYTILNTRSVTKSKMFESDASHPNDFHKMQEKKKKILYLDAPDIIVEYNSEPIFSIEISKEAGTGHNVFQRFARLGAAVENDVPAIFIYPEATIITRQPKRPGGSTTVKWDQLNGLIFQAMKESMDIYQIPALFFYFPSDFRTCPNPLTSTHQATKGLLLDRYRYADSPLHSDPEMTSLFGCLNEIITTVETHGVIDGRAKLLREPNIRARKAFMEAEIIRKGVTGNESPISSTKIIPTDYLLNYLSTFTSGSYSIGELLRSRPETLVYCVDAGFRGDPYAGALAAVDYLKCRKGKTFEDRYYNLVLCWGEITEDHTNRTITVNSTKCKVQDFVDVVKNSNPKSLLTKDYAALRPHEIPRYYMQVRYGSSYSKVKHIRVFSYFADAIIFRDGAFWRDA